MRTPPEFGDRAIARNGERPDVLPRDVERGARQEGLSRSGELAEAPADAQRLTGLEGMGVVRVTVTDDLSHVDADAQAGGRAPPVVESQRMMQLQGRVHGGVRGLEVDLTIARRVGLQGAFPSDEDPFEQIVVGLEDLAGPRRLAAPLPDGMRVDQFGEQQHGQPAGDPLRQRFRIEPHHAAPGRSGARASGTASGCGRWRRSVSGAPVAAHVAHRPRRGPRRACNPPWPRRRTPACPARRRSRIPTGCTTASADPTSRLSGSAP